MILNIIQILNQHYQLNVLLVNLIINIIDLIIYIKIQYLIILALNNLLLYNLMFFMFLMINLQCNLLYHRLCIFMETNIL